MFLPLRAWALLALAVGTTDPGVGEGLELYQGLKYDRAVVALGRALAQPGLSLEDRRLALETLGFSYTVLGDAQNAELTFHTLLDLVPAHELDEGLSPRLTSAFAQAKSTWLEGRHVRYAVTSPDGERVLLLELREGDPRRVGSAVVRDAKGATAPLACRERQCRGERPASEFTIEVLDHQGTPLARLGPLAPYVEEASTWWIWLAVGAVAIGGAITIGVAAQDDGAPPSGSLGRLQLP